MQCSNFSPLSVYHFMGMVAPHRVTVYVNNRECILEPVQLRTHAHNVVVTCGKSRMCKGQAECMISKLWYYTE